MKDGGRKQRNEAHTYVMIVDVSLICMRKKPQFVKYI